MQRSKSKLNEMIPYFNGDNAAIANAKYNIASNKLVPIDSYIPSINLQ